jgi:aminoglycoside phosphotransferase (APT) family kinase protein
MKPNEDSFNCLCHGDCWISNILFLNDENGNIVDCAFVDFQQTVYTSPAVDLLTLIITSADTKIKFSHFEHFIKIYHDSLVDILKRLNYAGRIPSLKELYIDAIDRSFLALWNGFAMLPSCLIENVEESSSDNLIGNDAKGKLYKEKLYNNDRYRVHMIELLTYFNNRGLVDLC